MPLVIDPKTLERVESDSHLLFEHASWRFYEDILREYDGDPQRINYADGLVELITLSYEHEQYSRFLHSMIGLIALERQIELAACGSTTFKKEVVLKGLEPDECYYIANESRVRGNKRLDLRDDPPPDLVIEIDVTHHVVDREAIYAAFGVPEMWRYRNGKLEAFALRDGDWSPIEFSLSLPFLKPSDFDPFLSRLGGESSTAILIEFREWVRQRMP
jgi:Uma2 family endonuclease